MNNNLNNLILKHITNKSKIKKKKFRLKNKLN